MSLKLVSISAANIEAMKGVQAILQGEMAQQVVVNIPMTKQELENLHWSALETKAQDAARHLTR